MIKNRVFGLEKTKPIRQASIAFFGVARLIKANFTYPKKENRGRTTMDDK